MGGTSSARTDAGATLGAAPSEQEMGKEAGVTPPTYREFLGANVTLAMTALRLPVSPNFLFDFQQAAGGLPKDALRSCRRGGRPDAARLGRERGAEDE